jgi:nitrite reductase/ring-hydroxylating ferredoxin subunit
MTDQVRVGSVSDFADGRLHAVDADGTAVIVGQVDGSLCAARNHCPHLGFSLTKGPGGVRFADGQVQCPWHNSRFDLRSGENLDWATGFAGREMPRWSQRIIALGRKPAPLTTYPVVVEGEDVFLDVPSSR